MEIDRKEDHRVDICPLNNAPYIIAWELAVTSFKSSPAQSVRIVRPVTMIKGSCFPLQVTG